MSGKPSKSELIMHSFKISIPIINLVVPTPPKEQLNFGYSIDN